MARRLARSTGVIAALCSLAGTTADQDKFPSKPVSVIVPFAAGGNTDVMARIFAEQLGKRLGQQLVIEDKAGAGGVTGLGVMAIAAPAGHTIGVGTSGGLAINPVLTRDRIPANVEKDLTCIYGMAAMPNIWIVHPSVPARNLTELPGPAYAESLAKERAGYATLMEKAGIKAP